MSWRHRKIIPKHTTYQDVVGTAQAQSKTTLVQFSGPSTQGVRHFSLLRLRWPINNQSYRNRNNLAGYEAETFVKKVLQLFFFNATTVGRPVRARSYVLSTKTRTHTIVTKIAICVWSLVIIPIHIKVRLFCKNQDSKMMSARPNVRALSVGVFPNKYKDAMFHFSCYCCCW